MRRRVVITGAGVVSPIGSGISAFHAGLRSGLAGVDEIRSFDASAFPTRIAGEVTDLDLGGVALPEAQRAALQRDPKSVFGLVAAREAAEAAFGREGPRRHYRPHEIGVLAGTGLEIFHLGDLAPHVLDDGTVRGEPLWQELAAAPPLSRLQIPADLGAACVAEELGAEGLLAVNVSACAAATQAIGEAFHAVRDGALEAALAGGYDSMVNPLGLGGFCLLQALSTSNELGGAASRPFDARRDGFVLSEGAGMLVLEPYDRARARGAPMVAELLGYASTLDAFSFTDPPPDHVGAIRAMEAALGDARLAPETIDYVNAHGTATRKNDPAETAAIRRVFGRHADRLAVSSTKSQIGHLIGAAGAVELLAGIFALTEATLPATINLTTPDPACDLDYVPVRPRPARVRTVLSNSLGFGGQNATIVVGAVR